MGYISSGQSRAGPAVMSRTISVRSDVERGNRTGIRSGIFTPVLAISASVASRKLSSTPWACRPEGDPAHGVG